MNIIKNILKNAIVGICIACLHVSHLYAVDISNISNPNNYVQKFNTQTYTVGNDGISLLYRGKDTGMRLATQSPAASKIKVTDPTIAKRPRPPRTTTTTTTTTPTPTPTPTPPPTTTTTTTTTTPTTSAKPKVSTGTKVMGALGAAAGAYGIYQANAGEGERTAGDLLSATASGAMAGASIGSIFPVIGTGVGTIAGAAIGALTVGFQMFSETDCLTDPITGKQTCCHTTTGDVIRGIGEYMFCGKDGQATTAVRQCQVGGRGESGGWFEDLFSDDAWSKDCMPRWCNGYSAPATGLEKYILAEPDTSNVCWKWRCGDGFKLTGDKKECVINFCDGEGPDEAERDLPVYTVNLIKEKNCYEWDCIEGYEVQDRYCVQLGTEPETGEIQESNEPLPAPVPAYDPYDDVIKKIEDLIKMMEEECGAAASTEDNKVLSDYQAKQQQKQKKPKQTGKN